MSTVDLTDTELAEMDDHLSTHLPFVRMAKELIRRRTAERTVPPAIRAGIDRYRQGIPPGLCLLAILQGDLYAAFQRADPDTRASMPAIVTYIVAHLSGQSYGSPEVVSRYLADAERALRGE